jgi:hypothetical protein
MSERYILYGQKYWELLAYAKKVGMVATDVRPFL